MGIMDYLPQLGDNAPQDLSGIPADDAMIQLQLKRKLAMADALRQQETPQGQMVSGRYVAPSWTQHLSNIIGKLAAGQQENEAMKQYGLAQTAKQAKLADLLAGKPVESNVNYQDAGGMPGVTQTTRQPYSQQEFMSKAIDVMPDLAPQLIQNQVAQYGKGNQLHVIGEGGMAINENGQVIASNPKPIKEETLKSNYANVQQDPQTGKFFGVNIKTNQVEQIPGAAMNPKPAMTPYEKESLGLRRQELNTKHTVDQGSVDATASMIANGQVAPLSGFAMKTDWGQQVMKRVNELNPQFSGATFANVKQAEQKFNVGKQGDTIRSLNVASSHLDTLGTLADALNTGNIQAVNKAANIWKTQTGSAAPTNFEGAKKIVADEVVKAVVGAGGTGADREEAARSIQAANSPTQLRGVINTYKDLMHGQLNGLRQQYEQSTGKTDFERFLSSQIKTQNAPSATRSAADAILGK
jgi:hypothetical protein